MEFWLEVLVLLVSATVDVLSTSLLVSNRYSIRSLDLENQNLVTLTDRHSGIIGIDFLYNESQVYFGNVVQDKIFRGKLESNSISDIETIVTGGLKTPEGIAVDWIAGNIYWVDGYFGHIEVAKLDGSYRTVLIEKNVGQPRALAVDPRVGFLFWSNWGEKMPSINRCSMSGDSSTSGMVYSVRQLSSTGWLNGLTLDYEDKRVYWADGKSDSIHSVMYDGSGYQEVLTSREYVPHPFAITLFEDKIYWTDWRKNSVFSANKFNGSDVKAVLRSQRQLFDVKIYHPSRQPSNPVPHPCQVSNGGCDQLCLIHPKNEHRCACKYGYNLNPDKKSCSRIDPFLLYAIAFPHRTSEIRGLSDELKTVFPPVFSEFNQTTLDYDPLADVLYWTDPWRKVINKAPLNGTQPKTTIMIETDLASPRGFAIDWVSRNMYFSTLEKTSDDKTKGRIWVSTLDGDYRKELIVTGVINSLVVHPMERKIFWIDVTENSQSIMSANMDGSDVTKLFPRDDVRVYDPKSLAIDFTNQHLYWLNGGKTPEGMKVVRSTLGGLRYTVVSHFDHGVNLTALALYENATESTVLVADAKGILMHNESADEFQYVWKFDYLYPRTAFSFTAPPHIPYMRVYNAKEKLGENACSKTNAGCSQLCLPVKNGAVCACADDYILAKDGKQCIVSCPPDFIKFGSSCYLFAEDASRSLSWHTANERCKEKSANLVTIESKDVHDFVKSQIKKVPDTQAWWIGLNDLQQTNKWVWSGTGEVGEYNGWYPGDPNAEYQHCVGLWEGIFEFNFIDADCNGYSHYKTSYICEKRALTEPR